MQSLKFMALEYGFAFIVAPLAYALIQWAKQYSAWVEGQSAWKKRAFVVVTATVMTILGGAIGIDFGITEANFANVMGNLDVEAIKAALAAAGAMGIHALKAAAKKGKKGA